MSSASSGHPSISPDSQSNSIKRWVESNYQHGNKVTLQKILGHTCLNPATLVYHPTQPSDFFYTSGSVVALYDQRADSQKKFFVGRRGHELSCLSVTEDGATLAAGEKGKNAAVILWDIASGDRTALLLGHSNTVSLIKFSPLRDYLIVVSEEQAVPTNGAAPPHVSSAASGPRTNLTLWRIADRQPVWSHTFTPADLPKIAPKSTEGASLSGSNTPASQTSLITSIDWSCDNSYFVIAGNKFLYYYYLRGAQQHSSTSLNADPAYKKPLVSLEKQEAKLGVQEGAEFVGIACGTGALATYTFGLTQKGILCAFALKDKKKKVGDSTSKSTEGVPGTSGAAGTDPPARRWEIEKWVDLRLPNANSLSLVNGVLAMSGADSKIRVFEGVKLEHIATLPRPQPLLSDKTKYPATILAKLSPDAQRVAAVYVDRSMVVWDARDPKKKPFRASQAHAGCIWDIAVLPNPPLPPKSKAFEDDGYDSAEEEKIRQQVEAKRKYPDGSFITCSADNSIRIWNVGGGGTNSNQAVSGKDPLWSSDCLATVYVPPAQSNPPGPTGMSSGLRCLRVIPTNHASSAVATAPTLGSYAHGLIASGDQQGNIRLHNLTDLKLLSTMEAHDREVRSLDFHQAPRTVLASTQGLQPTNLPLLTSGSRDSVVHLHNLHVPTSPQSLTPEQVHSSMVNQVRLTSTTITTNTGAAGAAATQEESLLLLSGGMDKQLSIRRVVQDSPVPLQSHSIDLDVVASAGIKDYHSLLKFEKSNVLDIVIHPTRKFAAILCNNIDKKQQQQQSAATPSSKGSNSMAAKPVNCIIKMIDLSSGRESRQYSIQTLGNGEPIRMILDPSGILLAISFSDKSVLLLDWYSGAVLTQFYAHSQVVTSMQFTLNCKSLLTVASDGCICVWKMPEEYVKAMQQRRKELQPKSKPSSAKSSAPSTTRVSSAGSSEVHPTPRSTAMNYLDDDSEEELDISNEDDEKSETEDDAKNSAESSIAVAPTAPKPAVAATPGQPPIVPPLPPLVQYTGDISIGRSASNSKVLPTWARSTVVSPEGAKTNGAGEGEGSSTSSQSPSVTSFPSGMGVGLKSGVESLPRGRWAQRVEVDASGKPTAHVAETNKVYGTMGTIGVGTLLLDHSDASSSDKPSEEQEVPEELIDLEGEGEDDDDEEEDSSSEFLRENYRGTLEVPEEKQDVDTSVATQNNSFLRSSMTSQFFQKLRNEGNLPGGSPAASPGPSSLKPSGKLGLPSSYVERENKTTAEVNEVRQQLRTMGILDDSNAQQQQKQSSSLTVPSEPAPSVSPNTSVVLSSSNNSSANSSGVLPAGVVTRSPEPPVRTSNPLSPPAPAASESVHSPTVHASLAALPDSARNLETHRKTIEQFQSSLQSLLQAFGQVKQAQVATRPQTAAAGGGGAGGSGGSPTTTIPSVSVSFAHAGSLNTAVIPVLPSSSPSFSGGVSSSSALIRASDAMRSSSVSFPSVAQSALGRDSASSTDLDTLASVYEEQLLTMQAVLAQVLPEHASPSSHGNDGASSSVVRTVQPLLMPPDSQQSPPPPAGTFMTQFPGSPPPPNVDPLGLSHTQGQLLQSMEFGMAQQAHMYDRMSEKLAQMVMQKLEQKVALGGTLSTTQQLALGLTLSGPPPVLPPQSFSSQSQDQPQ